jgi:indolepyruvate ferredoxin oxidoreductase alpha subunit
MHSSQNEQDNRYLAKLAKVPMLEPTDSQECKDFIGIALDMSERFDTPVMVRTTTRISHSKSLVKLGRRTEHQGEPYEKNLRRYVVPIYARFLRPGVEERLRRLAGFSEEFSHNTVEEGDDEVGIIASGAGYLYAKEVMPDATVLKLCMTNPLPKRKILEFAGRFEQLYVVEELEPYLEDQIRAWGVSHIIGKEAITNMGELSPEVVAAGLMGSRTPSDFSGEIGIMPRPPQMCAGCPHWGVFHTLRRLKLVATGDIGCYTMGALPPYASLHTTFCMGASVGNAFGLESARDGALEGKVVGVIGDSTFIHAGIPSLIDIVYNKGTSTIIICDNSTTGMTGHQEHPGTGYTLKGEKAPAIDYMKLAKAIGVRFVAKVDPHDLDEMLKTVRVAVELKEPAVVIAERPCALLPAEREKQRPLYSVDDEACNSCKACYRLGCPAMDRTGDVPVIDSAACIGCGVCLQVCRQDAIVEVVRER